MGCAGRPFHSVFQGHMITEGVSLGHSSQAEDRQSTFVEQQTMAGI